MDTHYAHILRHGIATLNTSAYDNLWSIGFDPITNDSIRIALTALHGLDYTRIEKMERELAADYMIHGVVPVAMKRMRMGSWFHAKPHDHAALMADLEFHEMVRFKGIACRYMADNYDHALKRTVKLIRMIDRELEAR